MTRLGIIGLGEVHRYHSAALSGASHWRVVGVIDTEASRNSPLPTATRCSGISELKDIGAEVALVAVPTDQHFSVAIDCIREGLDVLLEKPATLKRTELEHLYAEAAARNGLVFVAFHDTFGEEFIAFCEGLWPRLIANCGWPRRVHCRYLDPYAAEQALPQRSRSLDSSWMDSGSNALSVACSLFGRLEVVGADFTHSLCNGSERTEVAARVTLQATRSEQTTEVFVETDWRMPRKGKSTTLYFDDLVVTLNHTSRIVNLGELSGAEEVWYESRDNRPRLVGQYERLFRAALQNIEVREDNHTLAWQVHDALFTALEGE
ncbi:MAG: Gfo/Idh/MocA family oxidoreductase [Acidobacteria bacterium]|nr:Gfo/Idh/MocA family oxidoreductase [Acidobacteriota bacterium]